ncbi:MAG: response regulator [Lachnospiraceae bacterium]|nr:response regulator [Lachnospiraceae bacterium]
MKSIQTKIVLVITAIMIVVTLAFGLVSVKFTNKILDEDSDKLLTLTVDQSYRDMESMLSSVEQSVDIIYNYAEKRTETYRNFISDREERDRFTYDVSELGKSIAEKTPGAVSVYFRYNPDEFDPMEGFWYTKYDIWEPTETTDFSQYDKDDFDYVGWYYVPVETGKPMWMDPYYSPRLDRDVISYIIPYKHGNTLVGVIGMDIDLGFLREFVSRIRLYESGRAYLVSSQGDIVFHFDYPDGVSYKDITDKIRPFVNSVLNTKLDAVKTLVGIDKIKHKVISKKLRNGMILGQNAPVDEINVPRSSLTMQLLLISVIILLLAIAICLAFIRTIIVPLKKLTAAAEHYANGDYSDDMNTDSADEIGILSRTLQTMSNSLKQQIEIADSANRSKSAFLANMSHEIRTPINAILGFDEMILRESNEETVKTYAYNIKRGGRTLLSLINDILDFSKIESGKMEIIPVEYEPALLINDMLDMVDFRAAEKGLRVRYEVDDNIPKKLFGDDIRIREVITNLLTNAVKYTNEGSVTLTVRKLSSDGETAKLYVSVRDTGIGIKDEDRELLWDSYKRLDQDITREIEGTGLGLTITRKYLELMGSSLELSSRYGIGSDFYFEIEQKIIDKEPIGDFEQARKESKKKIKVYSESFEAPDAKVLVVDDIAMNLSVFKGLLKYSKINIDTATSGMEALALMRKNAYDIVFMDHMMPKMDGLETYARIVSDRDLVRNDMPVIALTANAVSGVQNQYIEAGFADYLTKPLDTERLEAVLLKYLPEDKVVKTKKSDKVPKEEDEKSGNLISKTSGMDNCDGNPEVYKIAVDSFLSEDFEESLSQAFKEENWKDYEVYVHGLKSSAKIIGAVSLFELAKESELSLKEKKDPAFVKENHERLMGLLEDVIKEVSAFV